MSDTCNTNSDCASGYDCSAGYCYPNSIDQALDDWEEAVSDGMKTWVIIVIVICVLIFLGIVGCIVCCCCGCAMCAKKAAEGREGGAKETKVEMAQVEDEI